MGDAKDVGHLVIITQWFQLAEPPCPLLNQLACLSKMSWWHLGHMLWLWSWRGSCEPPLPFLYWGCSRKTCCFNISQIKMSFNQRPDHYGCQDFFANKSQREVTENSVLLCLLFLFSPHFSFLFPSLPVPHHKEAGRWCRMAPKMDNPLRMLLIGSEGQAAMHQHPDVFLPSLLFYSPPPHQQSPGAETNLFNPSSSDSFAAKKSNSGSRDRSIACS